MRAFLRLVAVTLVVGLPFTSPHVPELSAGSARAQEAQQATRAVLVTESGRHPFAVELADTSATRSRGLMFRRELAPDVGMLFDFEQEQNVTMWMSNTYISLDMVFIRADGTVARIAKGTTPFSEETIAAGEPVLSVLEVIAGTADRIGLKPGDRVEHPLFNR